MDNNLWRCVNLLGLNNGDVAREVRHILLNTCERILRFPEQGKYREIRLSDPIGTKLLLASGGMECLFEVGFVEDDDCFILPQTVSLYKLQVLQKLLSPGSTLELCIDRTTGKYITIPKGSVRNEEKFYKHLIGYYLSVLRYEDLELQQKAKRLVPLIQLQINTMERMRELQKHIKINSSAEIGQGEHIPINEVAAEDLFLSELMNWFKCEFFKWMDNPTCTKCSGDCMFETVMQINHPQICQIEEYKCNNCKVKVQFHRYTDPEPLLTLRRGRCGEWANVFTLFCRSLGYDARIIYDHTDHLWTEVWSASQNRWLHLDPCENVMDHPLIYEKGWSKKLTYVIAFSRDEVQDVTWRYTRDPSTVLERRQLCSEEALLIFIEALNEQRQASADYSTSRKRYIVKRKLLELVQMLYLPNAQGSHNEEDYEGRSSGSYAWRLSRGEVNAKSTTQNIWYIPEEAETFKLQYFIVKDVYVVRSCNNTVEKAGWQTGVTVIEGSLFRKVEDYWKMVYLARSAGTSRARLQWIFELKDEDRCISTFELEATTAVFHGGNVTWEAEASFNNKKRDNVIVPIPDCTNFNTDKFRGAKKVTISVTLAGGEGDVAWQHAQLFRQSIESAEKESMSVTIHCQLIKRSS